MKCSECGADLKELGVLCEASLVSIWNEDRQAFVLDIENLSIKDFEVKCPECYTLGIDVEVERE